jgi:fatty acid desaturase
VAGAWAAHARRVRARRILRLAVLVIIIVIIIVIVIVISIIIGVIVSIVIIIVIVIIVIIGVIVIIVVPRFVFSPLSPHTPVTFPERAKTRQEMELARVSPVQRRYG